MHRSLIDIVTDERGPMDGPGPASTYFVAESLALLQEAIRHLENWPTFLSNLSYRSNRCRTRGKPGPLNCVREATMWTRIREKLADWYILIIFGICLIALGLLAPSTTPQSSTQAPIAPSRTNVATARQPQPSATQPVPSQPPAQKAPTSPAGSPAASVPPPDNSAAAPQTSACVARSRHADNGCERAAAFERERTGSSRGSRLGYHWRRRRVGRPPCVPKMPGMPFNGCRQEPAGSFAGRRHGP
jgi:hypothetical protein